MKPTPMTERELEIISLAEPFISVADLRFFRRQLSRWSMNRNHSAIIPALRARPRVHAAVGLVPQHTPPHFSPEQR
jgi:hypothetical protein